MFIQGFSTSRVGPVAMEEECLMCDQSTEVDWSLNKKNHERCPCIWVYPGVATQYINEINMYMVILDHMLKIYQLTLTYGTNRHH